MLTLYVATVVGFFLGFITCAMFASDKRSEPQAPAWQPPDIDRTYANLRNGAMTRQLLAGADYTKEDSDEQILRDAAEFERSHGSAP